MAYRNYRRRNYRPRRGGRRRMARARARPIKGTPSWFQYGKTAVAAYNMANKLYGMINSELKYSDVSITTAPTVAWQVFNLTAIAEGDDDTQRTGRSILAKSYYMDYLLKSGSGATNAAVVRVAVVQDRWQGGTDPTGLNDIYNAATVTTLRDIAVNPERFKVLYDRRHVLDIPSGGGDCAIARKRIPLDCHVKYIGTSNTDANCGRNNIYLLYIADQVTTNAVTMAFSGRLRYYDN